TDTNHTIHQSTTHIHCLILISSYSTAPHRNLPSFPTRRSSDLQFGRRRGHQANPARRLCRRPCARSGPNAGRAHGRRQSRLAGRSEEHTSELQSRGHLVCRLLLEKKKTTKAPNVYARKR